jgi:hypothetical protein
VSAWAIRTILAHCLFAETRKVDVVAISIDVKEFDTRAKVVHQLP